MSVHSITNSACQDYFTSLCAQESDVQRSLKAYVATLDKVPPMYIDALQGSILAFLARSIQAKAVLEIGTFVGYSTLWLARGLTSEGHITTCEVDPRWRPIALNAFEQAGVVNQVTLKTQKALLSLEEFTSAETPPQFDFIFVDADKSNYPLYYEYCLQLLSAQGMLVMDNVWWQGKLLDENYAQKRAQVLRKFNADLSQDPRIHLTMLPIGDGLSLIRKK